MSPPHHRLPRRSACVRPPTPRPGRTRRTAPPEAPGSASAPRPAGRSDSEQARVMGAFQRGT
ncbi:hypothetical protein AB0F09_33345, partial [Streptomyces olivaceus]